MSNDNKFILIDFDETLVTHPIGGYDGFEELSKQFDFPDDYKDRLAAYESTHLQEYISKKGVIESAKDERGYHEHYYKGLGRALGLRWRKLSRYVQAVVDRRMHELQFAEIDSIREVLTRWKEEGYMRIIFSNAFLSRQDAIKRMGLHTYSEAILLSAEVGSAKPDSAMYAHALEKFDLEAKNGWIVDNEVENIQAFVKMGGQGAVVNIHQKEPDVMKEGTRTINHIRELI